MRRYRRRAKSQYLLPFVILVSVGVFIILAFQLWGAFFTNAKGDATFYMAEGRSKVLSFGTNEWENLYNGSKVKLGDSVKTLKNAKGVIEFYDGTALRMDEETQITLVDISKKSDYQEILIYVNSGKIWVNKPKQNVIRKTDFVINTNYASYAIAGTVFALDKGNEEVLHVIMGKVQVDILEEVEGKTRTIESIPVSIGQQVILNERVMQEYYERKSPSVLSGIDPVFQTSAWYLWNIKEDETPTDWANRTSGTIDDEESTPDNSLGLSSLDTESGSVARSDLPAPKLTSHATAAIVTEKDIQKLEGTAEEGVKKLLLRQLLAGEAEPKKVLINTFDEDDLTWSYEISSSKGNLKSGSNIYEFVGIDENASETAPLRVEIEYQSAEEPDEANDTVQTELGKPEVSTVNGKSYEDNMTITKDGFAITGTISGADAIWVDDFKLNKFESGDTNWTYNAKVSYGNLVKGKNIFKVWGTTEDGKKSDVLSITINFEPPEEEVVAPESTTTVSTPVSAPAEEKPEVVLSPERPLNSAN